MNNNDWYEIKAEAFRICTGHMAPGKDPASASHPAPFEERMKAWEDWTTANLRLLGAFSLAFKRIVGDDEE